MESPDSPSKKKPHMESMVSVSDGERRCRICLGGAEDVELGDLFKPCRCSYVHRRCLDTWRSTGINPSNMTRCEVCHYHYKYAGKAKAWKLVMELVGTFTAEIVVFFSLAFCVGYAMKTSHVLDEVNPKFFVGFKPERKREYFVLGILFNCWFAGVIALMIPLWRRVCGRESIDERTNRRLAARTSSKKLDQRSAWAVHARHNRNRRWDCCDCHDHSWFYMYHFNASPCDCYCPADDCCFCCATGSCDPCGGCTGVDCASNVGGCGGGGEFDVLCGCVAFFVIGIILVLSLIGVFWLAIFNFFYVVQSNNFSVRKNLCHNHFILPYDKSADTLEQATQPETLTYGNETGLQL